MTITQHHPSATRSHPGGAIPLGTCAVAWIDGGKAIVARMRPDRRISTCELERGGEPELAYLALVIRAIGDGERVVIMGPGDDRLALEREYVSLYHRPERLVDVEPSGPVEVAEIVERLRELAG